MIQVYNEKTINIDGTDYWLVTQFSKLTNRSSVSIRALVNRGNRIRKLKAIRINDSVFIEAQELFEYPFVLPGKPAPDEEGICIEQFYLEDEKLYVKEKVYEVKDKDEICH